MSKITGDGAVILDTPEDIRHFQLLQLKHRLRLEAVGMRSRGPSALTQAKQVFGCKGNRAAVQEQIQALIDNSLAAKQYRGAGLYNNCTNFEPPNWADYDDFEVEACYTDPVCQCVEPILDANELHLAEFWTVYGHLHDGGVEAITDTTTEALAWAIVDKFTREHWAEMQAAAQIRAARTVSDAVH